MPASLSTCRNRPAQASAVWGGFPVPRPPQYSGVTFRPAVRYILAKEDYKTIMKRLVSSVLLTAGLLSGYLIAQEHAWSRRASSVSPEANAKADFDGKIVNINYSAPSLRGRPMLGIMKSDRTMPVWRAGANDATLLHTDAELEIGSLKVPKGEYTLFISLEDPAKWQLIVNKQIHQWGLTYDKAQDLGRVPMTMGKPPAAVETLKWNVVNSGGNKGKIELEWGDYLASVPFTVK
jgi:Protein of unknown function (DUF2911)